MTDSAHVGKPSLDVWKAATFLRSGPAVGERLGCSGNCHIMVQNISLIDSGEESIVIAGPGSKKSGRRSRKSDATVQEALTSAFARVERPGPTGASERYVILEQLGAGGCGEVFLAYDAELDRKVAIKKILHRHANTDGEALIVQEARLLAKLRHPNIVTVYDIQELPGEHQQESLCIIMEYVEGLTLRQWLVLHPRSRREILRVFQEAGRGLAAAHAAGVFHRDFKPDNVLVDSSGHARVLDFGLSQFESEATDELAITHDGAPEVTMPPLTGTPAYMAPERYHHPAGSVASDMFSFAVSLWEALVGQRPFPGGSVRELRDQVAVGEVVLPANQRHLTAHLRRVLRRALAVGPAQRYPGMESLLSSLAYNPQERWRRWVGIGSLVTGAVIVGSLFRSPEVAAQQCRGMDGIFATGWNESRVDALRETILGTDTLYAQTTWEHVYTQLDAYATEIRREAQGACEDARVRGRTSDELAGRRLACLHEREIELDAFVDALQTGGSDAIQRAIRATAALTPVASCDGEVLMSERTAAPRDTEVAAVVQEIRGELAKIKAIRNSGRPRDVMELAAQVVERAKSVGYVPVLAEAHLQHGDLYAAVMETKTAEEEYAAAWHHAIASDHDRVARDAANLLANELAFDPARIGEANVWTASADAVAQRVGVTDEHTYLNRVAVGRVLETQGRFGEAIEPMQEAARAAKAAYGPNSWEAISIHTVLSSIIGRSGDLDGATEEIEYAVRAGKTTFGDNHPALTEIYRQYGIVLAARGEMEQSIGVMQHMVELVEPAFGSESPRLAASLNSLGYTLCEAGRDNEGIEHLERALDIQAAHLEPDAFEYLLLRHNRAYCLSGMGRYDEARSVYEENRAQALPTLGEEHPFMAMTSCELGEVAYAVNDLAAAEQHYQRTLEIRESVFGKTHRELYRPLVGLAEVALRRGKHEQAIELAQRALDVRASDPEDVVSLARGRFTLARAIGPTPETRELAEQAKAGFLKQGVRGKKALAEVEDWLVQK